MGKFIKSFKEILIQLEALSSKEAYNNNNQVMLMLLFKMLMLLEAHSKLSFKELNYSKLNNSRSLKKSRRKSKLKDQ